MVGVAILTVFFSVAEPFLTSMTRKKVKYKIASAMLSKEQPKKRPAIPPKATEIFLYNQFVI